ncbi:DUF1361 domain-containing protein [Oscillochloris sp. ZM17-4]|nr:DUF1361 domain-containing protein [Oscillochloris sp. ZM17-4]
MRQIIQIHRRLASTLFYPSAAASALAVLLVIGRSLMSGVLGPRFLIWNLILAWMPYLMSLWVESAARRSWWRALLPGVLWLLFLPNAPYIMTDFIHLEWMGFVWWYDLGMLMAFAWAGCLLGVASLYIVQRVVRERLGAALSWAFVLASCGLSGLGIYFGRFLRWNSWDVLFSPRGLAHDLWHILSDPAHYPQMIGVSGLFACFLALGYLTLTAVRRA